MKYKKFINYVTGNVFYAPSGRYGNYLNFIKKLIAYVRYNIDRYYLVHVMLTSALNVTEIEHKNVKRVINFINQRLKRAGSEFKYACVKEIQMERLEKYGDRVIHYHILCIYSIPYVFPALREIQRSWGLGICRLSAPKIRMRVGKIAGYLGKYIGKGFEYELLDVRKMFSGSQIKQIYKLSEKRLKEVMDRFGKVKAESFECTFTRVFIKSYEMIGDWVGKRTTIEIMRFKTDWHYCGEEGEVF